MSDLPYGQQSIERTKMSRLSRAWRKFLSARQKNIWAQLIGQQANDDGTVDCRFALSDGSAQYTLVVPASSDGYYEHVRRNGGFGHVAELMYRLCRRGDTVFDFGANVGTESIPLAAKGCIVYAFEILPENVTLLASAVTKNPGIKLEIVHRAIWRGQAALQASGHSAWGRISAAGKIAVKAVSLDDFVRAHGVARVDAIKLDVEGSELAALEGMRGVLSEFKPQVVFEANALTCGENGYSIYELFEFFKTIGYSLYQINNSQLIPFSRHDVQFVITTDYLATLRPPSALTRALCHVGSFSPESLMALMRSHGMTASAHRKYMALHRNALPCAVQTDCDFAGLLKTWSDEAADDHMMSSIRTGCRRIMM
jgi:FkbM family methyltransferase